MIDAPPPRRLLVAIHDVAPPFLDPVERLAARLETLLDGPRLAMLVIPDYRGDAPIERCPAIRARLRDWADRGVEMVVHGWSHRDDSTHRGLADRLRATHMTAREGEFLGLDRAEARRRMRIGRDTIEQITGRAAAGFVAPAWLTGAGARAALRDEGFAFCEDHVRVWSPVSGHVLARGPVVTWASRSVARTASSLAFAAAARAGLHRLATVRIAVHPGDTGKPEILASIDRTIGCFARRRPIGRYADLLPAATMPAATMPAATRPAATRPAA